MSRVNDLKQERLEEVLAFCDEKGEPATCEQFNINIETLHRYQREKRWRETQKPKILLLDIETAPLHGNFWSTGKQYVSAEQIETDWFIFGYSAKWLLSPEMMSDFVTPKEAVKRDDKRVMVSAHKLVNEADIIIGHNIKKFDIPKLKTRFFMNGLKPPMPYQLLDTLKVAWKEFAFASAKLNYLSQVILRKEKIKTDRSLWARCENGDQEALDYMEEYCRMDTQLLEDVYMELRGWMTSHPNLPLLMNANEPACPNCGSFEFTDEEGVYATVQNLYPAKRCASCGCISHERKSIISKDQRKVLLIPNAR
jgi:DNA polymerase elongation subunit (family B)/predicted nucleic-acid-binding Zn-ribbon protein